MNARIRSLAIAVGSIALVAGLLAGLWYLLDSTVPETETAAHPPESPWLLAKITAGMFTLLFFALAWKKRNGRFFPRISPKIAAVAISIAILGIWAYLVLYPRIADGRIVLPELPSWATKHLTEENLAVWGLPVLAGLLALVWAFRKIPVEAMKAFFSVVLVLGAGVVLVYSTILFIDSRPQTRTPTRRPVVQAKTSPATSRTSPQTSRQASLPAQAPRLTNPSQGTPNTSTSSRSPSMKPDALKPKERQEEPPPRLSSRVPDRPLPDETRRSSGISSNMRSSYNPRVLIRPKSGIPFVKPAPMEGSRTIIPRGYEIIRGANEPNIVISSDEHEFDIPLIGTVRTKITTRQETSPPRERRNDSRNNRSDW